MKAIYVTAAVILIASLLTSWWLYKRNAELIAEREAAALSVIEPARKADDAAFGTYAKARDEAAARAQGARDALKTDPTDTVADILQRCRDSLRQSTDSYSPDAAQGADASLRKTESAGVDDARR